MGIQLPLSVAKKAIEKEIHNSGLEYYKEFKFCKTRRFRSDWCVPSLKLLVEYEGLWFGNSRRGSGKSRHTTVSGYTKDTEKYNLATLLGYRVLRYTTLSYSQFKRDFEYLKSQPIND